MKGWKRSLVWEGLPLIMLVGVFGFIAAINWDYEAKLLTADPTGSKWTEIYLGPILLGIAVVLTLLASAILLTVRLVAPQVTSSAWLLAPLTIVAILFIFPSLFIVILGPASITMIEQMRASPR
jgi:hypothetical protein